MIANRSKINNLFAELKTTKSEATNEEHDKRDNKWRENFESGHDSSLIELEKLNIKLWIPVIFNEYEKTATVPSLIEIVTADRNEELLSRLSSSNIESFQTDLVMVRLTLS